MFEKPGPVEQPTTVQERMCPISVIDLSRIPVNKGIKSRLGWTIYSDLYEIVHPSLDLISLCLFTGAECGKGLLYA